MTTLASQHEPDDLFYKDLIQSCVEAPGLVERPWLAQRVEETITDPDCRSRLIEATRTAIIEQEAKS